MARARSARDSRRSPPAAPPAAGSLPQQLQRLVEQMPDDHPLPTTRELGGKFGLANTTVYRALRDMVAAGDVWQHPTNGRFYPAGARALLDRPKPVACLLRRLELASELYRELLEGISAGCGERQRTMLLWHDALLVNHPDPQRPPFFASPARQRAILEDFLNRHGDSAGGFLLDHIWANGALQTHARRLRPAVVLFRSCDLAGIGNIAVDFHAGALKALAHLLGRGFEHITYVQPFHGDPAVGELQHALYQAAEELACRSRISVALATTARERASLIAHATRSAKRHALLCPEDNVARLLAESARAAGARLPQQLGILSVMGTDFAVNADISCLRYDFRALGRQAVEALDHSHPVRRRLPPKLLAGSTT